MDLRDLSSHVEYEAGGGRAEVARAVDRDPDDLVLLASNESPLGPSPAAVEAVRETVTRAHRYPKAAHADLQADLAGRWGVADDRVWLGPGADGAIDYLHRATLSPGDRVLVPDPGFAYYGMSARYHHGEVATYDLDAAAGFPLTAGTVLEDYDGERVVYLTSPHNPTGGRFDLDAVSRIAGATDPQTLVVVDEAYAEFADAPSAVRLLGDRDDVAVLRTFSKAYGLAGLRLGYAVVPAAWSDAYAKVNTPFAVNDLACRAGIAALSDESHLARTVETARASRATIERDLDAPTLESAANFVLADVGDAERVTEAAAERGVVIRDCTSFGLPGHVRITCGLADETRAAVETVNEVLAEVAPT